MPASDLRLLALWTAGTSLGTLVGLVVGLPVGYLVSLGGDVPLGIVVSIACAGAVLAFCQSLPLRRRLPPVRWWVVATAVSWATGTLLAATTTGEEGLMRDLSRFVIDAVRAAGAENPTTIWLDLAAVLGACGLVVGAITGLGQWLVLRRRCARAGWWIAASALGWGLAGAVAVPGGTLGWMGNVLLIGATAGATTGFALLRLLRHPRTHH